MISSDFKWFQVISFWLCLYLFTHEINWRRSAQQNREAAKHPRQIGRLKVHQAEKVHANRRIPSTPNVNEHYSQRVAQKHGANEKCDQLEIDINWNKFLVKRAEKFKESKYYNYENATEQKHEKEVGRTATKWALFKVSTISVCEQHVKQEAEADRSKIAKVGYQAPNLYMIYKY